MHAYTRYRSHIEACHKLHQVNPRIVRVEASIHPFLSIVLEHAVSLEASILMNVDSGCTPVTRLLHVTFSFRAID